MLDAFIIEEIQRRERAQERQQPRIERPGTLPFPLPPEPSQPRHRDDDDDDDHTVERGVVIFDM